MLVLCLLRSLLISLCDAWSDTSFPSAARPIKNLSVSSPASPSLVAGIISIHITYMSLSFAGMLNSGIGEKKRAKGAQSTGSSAVCRVEGRGKKDR